MQNIHSGCGAALAITCALWATVSCGDVAHDYRATDRAASAGNAGKSSNNTGGARPGGAGTGGTTSTTVGGPSGGGFSSSAGGSAPGQGNPSQGAAGSSQGTVDPLGTAGSTQGPVDPSGTAGSSPGAAGSSPGAAGSSQGTAGSGPTCTNQQHMCLGACVSNSSVDTCGGSCDPCQVPAGGTATCDGNQCGFSCGSMKKCGSKCIPGDGCCSNNDCPAQNGMARQCDTSTNTCMVSGCASGFKPCNGACIANNACCSDNDCGGTCQKCSGPGGSCTQVKNADDNDSCAGTCDNNGNCKSKRGQSCTTASGGCIDGSPCVDGYCCDSQCKGQCQACDIKNKQGTCSPVPQGAPHGGRSACTTDGTSCGGSCSGKADGTCNYSTDDCGQASCVSGKKNVLQDHGKCNAGSCKYPDQKTCDSSLICSNNACLGQCTKDADCMSGLQCDTSSKKCKSVPKEVEVTIASDVSHSGTVTTAGVVTTNRLDAGDDAGDNAMCFFVAFDTSQIPKGSTVESATLTIQHLTPDGTPKGTLTAEKMAKVCNTIELKCLTANGGDKVAISTGDGSGSKSASVKTSIAADVTAGQTLTQFRFCLDKKSANQTLDVVHIIASGSALRPQLKVTYTAP